MPIGCEVRAIGRLMALERSEPCPSLKSVTAESKRTAKHCIVHLDHHATNLIGPADPEGHFPPAGGLLEGVVPTGGGMISAAGWGGKAKSTS